MSDMNYPITVLAVREDCTARHETIEGSSRALAGSRAVMWARAKALLGKPTIARLFYKPDDARMVEVRLDTLAIDR